MRSPKVLSRSEVWKGSNLTWSRTHHRSFKYTPANFAAPPLEIGPPTKIFDRHARYAYLYLYYSGFDTKSVEMQL